MRILLSRTDRVGDLILSTPAIASVRRSYPDAHVTLAASRYNAVVVDRSPDVDAVVSYPAEVRPDVFGARFHDIDLAIALSPRDVDHRIVAATRAQRRVGYTYATRWVARLGLRSRLTEVVLSEADPACAERDPSRVVAHEVDQVLAVVAAAGAEELCRELVLPVTAEDRASVAALPPRPIVVQLGRRWTERGSTTASCLALFRELRALGRPLIATYGDDARELGAQVASAVHAPTVVLFEHAWFRLASQEWSPYRVPNAVLRKPPDETDASLRASRAEIFAAVAALL